MHIGRISRAHHAGHVRLRRRRHRREDAGRGAVLPAKRITMYVPWWTLFRKRLEVEVELNDWKMTVESFAGGGAQHPEAHAEADPNKPRRKLPFTTTVRFVYAKNGEFVYVDHVTPWSVAAQPQLQLVRAENLKAYVGKAQFDGRARPDSEVPADARGLHDAVRARRRPRAAAAHRSHHRRRGVARQRLPSTSASGPSRPTTSARRSTSRGCARCSSPTRQWRIAGEGGFEGIFQLFKGGCNLSGQFTSEDVGGERVGVSRPARLARLGAEALRRDARRLEVPRRRHALHLRPRAARHARTARPRASAATTRTSTSAR